MTSAALLLSLALFVPIPSLSQAAKGQATDCDDSYATCRSGVGRAWGGDSAACDRMSSVRCRRSVGVGRAWGGDSAACDRMSSVRCRRSVGVGRAWGGDSAACDRMSSVRCRRSVGARRASGDRGRPRATLPREPFSRRAEAHRRSRPGSPFRAAAAPSRNAAANQSADSALLAQAIRPAWFSPLDLGGGWGSKAVVGVVNRAVSGRAVRNGFLKAIVGVSLWVGPASKVLKRPWRPVPLPRVVRDMRRAEETRRRPLIRNSATRVLKREPPTAQKPTSRLLHGRRPDPAVQLRIGGKK